MNDIPYSTRKRSRKWYLYPRFRTKSAILTHLAIFIQTDSFKNLQVFINWDENSSSSSFIPISYPYIFVPLQAFQRFVSCISQ